MIETAQPTANSTLCWVEMAFDWDADPHPTVGFHLLQLGLVKNPEGEATNASFANAAVVGDHLGFVLYDNTDDARGSGEPPHRVVENVEVWFAPTRPDQGNTSPFELTTGLAVRPRSAAGPRRPSTSFGGDLPAWPLFKPSRDPGPGSTPESFELLGAGRFYLSARVSISAGGETRAYRVDPEMIVNDSGSGDG